MNRQPQKKQRTLTRAARVLAAVTVMLSLLSIQQVWAEEFCACDHNDPSSSASEHCSKHAAQHEHCQGAQGVATHEQAAQTEQNEDAEAVVTHQHAAQHEHAEESHSTAIEKLAEPSCGDHASRDATPSGSSAAERLESATKPSERDGSSTPAKLDCCHILPAANLPAASFAVYTPDVATDSAPVVLDSAPAQTFIPAIVFHPPRARPIYVTVSSFLI